MFKLVLSEIQYEGKIWCPWVWENMTPIFKSRLVEKLNKIIANKVTRARIQAYNDGYEDYHQDMDGLW